MNRSLLHTKINYSKCFSLLLLVVLIAQIKLVYSQGSRPEDPLYYEKKKEDYFTSNDYNYLAPILGYNFFYDKNLDKKHIKTIVRQRFDTSFGYTKSGINRLVEVTKYQYDSGFIISKLNVTINHENYFYTHKKYIDTSYFYVYKYSADRLHIESLDRLTNRKINYYYSKDKKLLQRISDSGVELEINSYNKNGWLIEHRFRGMPFSGDEDIIHVFKYFYDSKSFKDVGLSFKAKIDSNNVGNCHIDSIFISKCNNLKKIYVNKYKLNPTNCRIYDNQTYTIQIFNDKYNKCIISMPSKYIFSKYGILLNSDKWEIKFLQLDSNLKLARFVFVDPKWPLSDSTEIFSKTLYSNCWHNISISDTNIEETYSNGHVYKISKNNDYVTSVFSRNGHEESLKSVYKYYIKIN
jgi:hypothetical protein